MGGVGIYILAKQVIRRWVGVDMVVACSVICWFWWLNVMLGMEKSALMGPRIHNHSIPDTTSTPSMGGKKKW